MKLRMIEVRVRNGESIDSALRRLKRLCREDFRKMRKRRHYVKPSDIRRKRKTERKRRKA